MTPTSTTPPAAPRPTPQTARLVAEPTAVVPGRRPGSVRRTSHLMTRWPEGHDGAVTVEGRARDLLTEIGGEARVLATADLTVVQAPDKSVRSVELMPSPAHLESIVGASPGRGFRRVIRDAFDAGERGTLGYFLIEDLPTASLLSTFAWSRRPETRAFFFDASRRSAAEVAGVCSGYRPGGIALELRAKQADVSQNVAVTTPLDRLDDPLAWHELVMPDGTAMCRRRRMDVWAEDGCYRIDAMFRDNTWELDGDEAIVHEYGLTATVDRATSTLTALDATPRVLPYPECPLAADEIQRCLGMSVASLRSTVLDELRGIESCTHLTDMLRALAELPGVLAHLDAVGPARA